MIYSHFGVPAAGPVSVMFYLRSRAGEAAPEVRAA
jgi:hypothetical protein